MMEFLGPGNPVSISCPFSTPYPLYLVMKPSGFPLRHVIVNPSISLYLHCHHLSQSSGISPQEYETAYYLVHKKPLLALIRLFFYLKLQWPLFFSFLSLTFVMLPTVTYLILIQTFPCPPRCHSSTFASVIPSAEKALIFLSFTYTICRHFSWQKWSHISNKNGSRMMRLGEYPQISHMQL